MQAPREIYAAPIPGGARALLSLLWTYARPDTPRREAWPAQSTLAALTGCDVRTVRRQLRAIEAAGYARRAKIDGRPGWILLEPWHGDRAPVSAEPGAGVRSDRAPVSDRPGAGVRDTGHARPPEEKRREKEEKAKIDAGGSDSVSWRAILTEAGSLTPIGAPRLRPGAQPVAGLVDRLAEGRDVLATLHAFAALCRADPSQVPWWGPGMFQAKRWAEIERRVAKSRAPADAEAAPSWAISKSWARN